MGFLYSKPLELAKNSSLAVQTKMRRSTIAVKNAVANGFANSYNSVYNTISSAKRSVFLRINNIFALIVYFIQSTCAIFASIYNCISYFIKSVLEFISSSYNMVTSFCRSNYMSVKTYSKEKLIQWRRKKFSWKEKILYTLIFSTVLSVMLFCMSVINDISNDDFASAHHKVKIVKNCFRVLKSYCYWILSNLLVFLRKGIVYVLINLYFLFVLVAEYAWRYSCIMTHYTVIGFTEAGRYCLIGLGMTKDVSVHYGAIACEKTWNGMNLFLMHSRVFLSEALVWGWEYGKVAFAWTLSTSVYLSKQCFHHLYHGSIAFLHALKLCTIGILTGSYSASEMAIDGSKFIASSSYQGGLAIVYGANTTFSVTSHYLKAGGELSYDFLQSTFTLTSQFLHTLILVSCEWFFYAKEVSIIVGDFLKIGANYVVQLICVGNKYFLHVGYIVCSKVAEFSCVAATIIAKFLQDLVVIVSQALFVLANNLYNILYIIVVFIINVGSGIASIIKFVLNFLVYLTTSLFSGIIFVLRMVSSVYMAALNKYNVYREFLFFAFIALVTLYLSGFLSSDKDETEPDLIESSEDDNEEFTLPEQPVVLAADNAAKMLVMPTPDDLSDSDCENLPIGKEIPDFEHSGSSSDEETNLNFKQPPSLFENIIEKLDEM